MLVYTCNPSTQEVEQEDSLSHMVTPYLDTQTLREKTGEYATDPEQANLGEKTEKPSRMHLRNFLWP